MSWIDWLIMLVPFAGVLGLAIYARKYARDVVTFLAAGRCAGRYAMSVGDLSSGLSVISLVALVEAKYKTGFAIAFWETVTIPLGMIFALSGYCIYRYRATRCLSIGQFLEKRYSHSFRIVAATIRTLSEMVANAISPAIAANFFIYYLGLPHRIHVWGMNLPCFSIVVFVCLVFAIVAIWPAGRVSLLITDTFQGLLMYPIFVIFTGYILLHFGWGKDIVPVMLDRVPGESFLSPFDIAQLRDFNLFAVVVDLIGRTLNAASWYGNDSSNSGRTPHEQKMANVIGTWRNGFSAIMLTVIAMLVITIMNGKPFYRGGDARFDAHSARLELMHKVGEEILPADATEVREALAQELDAFEVPVRGSDAPPFSQLHNLDTEYIDVARGVIYADLPPALAEEAARIEQAKASGETHNPSAELAAAQGANARRAQHFRTTYGQMMLPVTFRRLLPKGLLGLFGLLMIMLLVSTDDSRIFNATGTIVQDCILPYLKKAPSTKTHLLLIRLTAVGVAIFFFIVAVFFAQLDYINMFKIIMCSLWLGGAGPVMIFGLYSRFGNTAGAWASLAFGCGSSLVGLVTQRTWQSSVYPFLDSHGWAEGMRTFLARVSSPLAPYVDWNVSAESFAEKFPINSNEIYLLSMILGVVAYVVASLVAIRLGVFKPYNLDALLHRGEYADEAEKERLRLRAQTRISIVSKLIGINAEYSRGDRIIAWSSFLYTIGYQFVLCFLCVLVWNKISPWKPEWWSHYFFLTNLAIPAVIGVVSTVWFTWGGTRDLRDLFRDLAAREASPEDNGFEQK